MPVVGVIEKLSERYAVPSDHRRHVSWDSHRRRPMMSEPFDPADTDAWIAHGRSPVQAAALADAWRRFPDLANDSPLDQRMARMRERVTALRPVTAAMAPLVGAERQARPFAFTARRVGRGTWVASARALPRASESPSTAQRVYGAKCARSG